MSRFADIRAGTARRSEGQPPATRAPRHLPKIKAGAEAKSKHYYGWVGHPYGVDNTPIAKKRAKAKIGRDTARRQRIAASR